MYRLTGVLLTITALAGVSHGQQAGTRVNNQAPTTVVRGLVIRSDSRQPVAGVPVSINMPGASPMTTDGQGRFTFERIPPGQYNVFAYPDGYNVGADGSLARIIVAATPAPVDVELVLTPFGSINGTVRDPDGHPLASVPIDVKALATRNGRRLMTGALRGHTDARGAYRLAGLSPGEYYVSVTTLPLPPSREREGWMRTYFPATTDPAAAIPIVVTAGADVTDRNITIQSVATYRVSGTLDSRLSTAERQQPSIGGPAGATSFLVVRVGSVVDDDPVLYENLRGLQRTVTGALEASDDFELRGIATGTYDLYPIVYGTLNERDQIQGVRAYTGRTRVTVVDRDVTGVRAVVRRGQDVRLREVSRARAATPPPAPGSLAARELEWQQLALSPKEPIPILASREGGLGVRPGADGIFVVPNVTEGRYDVELNHYYPYPSGEYLADIRQNGRSILESGVTVTEQSPALIDVVFEAGGATIKGMVRDGHKPTFNRLVVLLPRSPGRRRAVHTRTISADSNGAYSFTNIAPGDYLVFAPTTSRDWKNDSDLMVRTLARGARPVTVGRGATLTVPVEVLDTRLVDLR